MGRKSKLIIYSISKEKIGKIVFVFVGFFPPMEISRHFKPSYIDKKLRDYMGVEFKSENVVCFIQFF